MTPDINKNAFCIFWPLNDIENSMNLPAKYKIDLFCVPLWYKKDIHAFLVHNSPLIIFFGWKYAEI